MSVPAIPLNDGNRMPVLAFGTGSKFKGMASNPTGPEIIESGFSHIDSAACESVSNFAVLVTGRLRFYPPGTVIYANGQYVGAAIRECGVARQDIWITTKYAGGNVLDAVHTSLRKLGLEHLDLYLVHGPWAIKNGDVEGGVWSDTVRSRSKSQGCQGTPLRIARIGVSNFPLEWLQRIGKVVPAVNRVQWPIIVASCACPQFRVKENLKQFFAD